MSNQLMIFFPERLGRFSYVTYYFYIYRQAFKKAILLQSNFSFNLTSQTAENTRTLSSLITVINVTMLILFLPADLKMYGSARASTASVL